MKDFRVQYILTMPKQKLEDASPWFGFTPGVHSVVPLVKTVLNLPQHVMQLAAGRDNCIAMRISGATYQLIPLETQALPYLPVGPLIPFWCVLSTDLTFKDVDEFIASRTHPILHISTSKGARSITATSVTRRDLLDLVKRVVSHLPQLLEDDLLRGLNGLDAPFGNWESVKLGVPQRFHFSTMPNELALKSLGYEFDREERLLAAGSDAPYVGAIVESANALEEERSRVISIGPIVYPPPVNLILLAPAIYQHLYKVQAKPNESIRVPRQILNAFAKQGHYYLEGDRLPLEEAQSYEFSAMVKSYRQDLYTCSMAATAKAANSFAPVLRLPPSINRINGELSALGSCARADRKAPHRVSKESKLLRKIGQTLSTLVPQEFLGFIDRPMNRIKLIGNTPIEWLPIRGLPMMIRYETSRIPSTPGFTFFSSAVISYEKVLHTSYFNEVLVIRSFGKNDQMRNYLSTALEIVAPQTRPGFRYKLVDVATIDEFVSAVNSFDGAVMIFDGHGRPSTLSEIGAIALDGTPVDIWKYREQIKVPPVVILSACDTHPIDGSHASVANAFLMLGASTVLGTLLPIDARQAAVFISRLVLRISEYIPHIVQDLNQPLRWSSVVHGLLQMSYVSEQMGILKKKFSLKIDLNEELALQMMTNNLVFGQDPEWYEKVKTTMADVFQCGPAKLEEALITWAQLPDTLKYLQLGNPDQILILKN